MKASLHSTGQQASSGGGATSTTQPNTFCVDPPPFGVGSQRFSKQDAQPGCGPAYHVAYSDIMSCAPRWDIKGWAAQDDPIKRGRGTSGGRTFSCMAGPSDPPASGSSLQPMFATYPNETRLQELLDLQRRRTQGVPPPGAYQVPGWGSGRTTFRRPAVQALDGPFPAPSHQETTRVREMAATLVLHTGAEAVGPGEYDAPRSKEASSRLRSTPSHRISQSARQGHTPHLQSLSISRSLQHGIDWHVPVIVQAKPPEPRSSSSNAPLAALQQRGDTPGQPADGVCSSSSRPQALAGAGQHYMEASPPAQPDSGSPPAAPSHVARNIRKQLRHQPGAWDWDSLSYNYRHNWTNAGGGAYLHGNRSHMRRASTAPQLFQAQRPPPAQPGGMPGGMYAIAEETSTLTEPQQGALPVAPPSSVPALYSHVEVAAGMGGSSGAAALVQAMASPRDMVRHAHATQAAGAVQEIAARQSRWAAKSGVHRQAPVGLVACAQV